MSNKTSILATASLMGLVVIACAIAGWHWAEVTTGYPQRFLMPIAPFLAAGILSYAPVAVAHMRDDQTWRRVCACVVVATLMVVEGAVLYSPMQHIAEGLMTSKPTLSYDRVQEEANQHKWTIWQQKLDEAIAARDPNAAQTAIGAIDRALLDAYPELRDGVWGDVTRLAGQDAAIKVTESLSPIEARLRALELEEQALRKWEARSALFGLVGVLAYVIITTLGKFAFFQTEKTPAVEAAQTPQEVADALMQKYQLGKPWSHDDYIAGRVPCPPGFKLVVDEPNEKARLPNGRVRLYRAQQLRPVATDTAVA